MGCYYPEGWLIDTPENQNALRNVAALGECLKSGRILEAKAAVCDGAHNLWVSLGPIRGLIPRQEGALGVAEGTTKDIAMLSRVGKPVCFVVQGFTTTAKGETVALLSRRAAQERCQKEFLSQLLPGDILPARVTHLDQFGCFADIGCGISSLLPIDAISVSRISHPKDRFKLGQIIRVVVRALDAQGRICLSHKELLGTWEENAARFHPGETVAGIVRSIENYGVFVELAPNLAGLAEPYEELECGQQASVYIKSLIPEKMKIKLIIIDAFDQHVAPDPPCYFMERKHIDRWQYSPDCCQRVMETVFSL
mgnify:CR=1 FL=1